VLDRLQRSFELTWRTSLNARGPGLSSTLTRALNVSIRYRYATYPHEGWFEFFNIKASDKLRYTGFEMHRFRPGVKSALLTCDLVYCNSNVVT